MNMLFVSFELFMTVTLVVSAIFALTLRPGLGRAVSIGFVLLSGGCILAYCILIALVSFHAAYNG